MKSDNANKANNFILHSLKSNTWLPLLSDYMQGMWGNLCGFLYSNAAHVSHNKAIVQIETQKKVLTAEKSFVAAASHTAHNDSTWMKIVLRLEPNTTTLQIVFQFLNVIRRSQRARNPRQFSIISLRKLIFGSCFLLFSFSLCQFFFVRFN